MIRRCSLIVLALTALTFSAFAQAKHPFTFEDLMKLKRVGEPVVSPNGKWVLFSVVDVSLEANTKTPHIWIVPLNADAKAGSSTPVGMTEGREREIIGDQDGDRPRWAPDGKRFAFVSTKGGGSQVWIADFDSAAGSVTGVHRITSIATQAGGELWSPDGKNILFTSDVYPECDGAPAEEDACNEKKIEEQQKSKVKAQIFDHLLYRHWNAYKEGKRSHIFVSGVPVGSSGKTYDQLQAIPRDLTPGDYDAPVFSLGGQDDYAFSPDGQEICYASNHDKNPAASTNNDLWIVPVNAGTDHVGTAASAVQSGEAGQGSAADAKVELRSTRQPGAAVATQANAYVSEVLAQTKNITADNPASDSSPLYSPDGKYIAYRAQQRPGYESDRFRLMLYDRKTGEKKNLTEGFDQWVGTFVWAPDSRELFFSAEERGANSVYDVSLTGETSRGRPVGELPRLGCWNDDFAITDHGKRIVYSRQSLFNPTELFVSELDHLPVEFDNCDRQGGPIWISALTHINAAVLDQLAILPVDISKLPLDLNSPDADKKWEAASTVNQFIFPGAHGDKVQGFLVKPPNFDASKKYPVKFLIHGGPQGAWGDDWSYRWNPELFASPTSTASSGYVVIMINFHGSTGYGQKFIDAINGDWGGAPYEDLMKGLDYAEKTYPFIDKNRECALGASYGGYAINWIMGHTNRFKCLVSHDGMFNAESAWGSTEEMWFNDWEFKGTPYDNRESYVKWSPHQYAKNFKTPTLVIHGQRDYRLDVSEGFQLFTTLQMQGVPSKMLYFPDEGHWIQKPQNAQLWYKTVNDWVDQWIGDKGMAKGN